MTDHAKLLELAKAAQKIAPGQWETDSIDNENGRSSFKSYALGFGPVNEWKAIADSLNSDCIIVEEDFDECHHSAWDENSRVIFEFLAAANPETIIALLSELSALKARVDGEWQQIETAPKAFHPPLSTINWHSPTIFLRQYNIFFAAAKWGGPSQPYWQDLDHKRITWEPSHWMGISDLRASDISRPTPPAKDESK